MVKYDPKYCSMIVDFRKKGGFLHQFAKSIGVHVSTLLRWFETYPEFNKAARCSSWEPRKYGQCSIDGDEPVSYTEAMSALEDLLAMEDISEDSNG